MRKVIYLLKSSVLILVVISLTACSGKEDDKRPATAVTEDNSEPLQFEDSSTEAKLHEKAETDVNAEKETYAGTEAETEIKVETETELDTETEAETEMETETESVSVANDVLSGPTNVDLTELYGLSEYARIDDWSIPASTVNDVPKDLIRAALSGNKSMYTYLGSQELSYDYFSNEYYKGYAFLTSPARMLEYDIYGAVRYDKDEVYTDGVDMMLLILPRDNEEYVQVLDEVQKYLKNQSSYECSRLIAVPESETETEVVYSTQEYIIDGKACYVIEGYRNNDIFFDFGRFGFGEEGRMSSIRYQGDCEKCIVLMSRNGLGFLSEDSSIYDLERFVQYEDSYLSLMEQSDGQLDVYPDDEYPLDEFQMDTDISPAYCYYAYDTLDYEMMNAENEEYLQILLENVKEDTIDLIRHAGRLEKLNGYKGVYYNLLNTAALLIRRGATDAASEIVSYLENQWDEENKTDRLAAFGDSEYSRLSHDEAYLRYLKEVLPDEEECNYLKTIWEVRTSVPYQFGERDVKYDSLQYKKEYQPLIDQLTELKGYRNAPLYVQSLLQPFLKQTIAERNTDAANQIIAMMEEHFPECGEYVLTEKQMKEYHNQIDTIIEEEVYKAAKRKELSEANEGNVVCFGTQDDKNLEWIILKKQEDRVLLLMNNCYELSAFGKQQTKIEYSDSYIKDMLENEIYKKVFTNAEKQMLLSFTPGKDGTYSFNEKGNHFNLLGTKEIKEYFPDKEDRILYADGEPIEWWLRTGGNRPGFVRYIDKNGIIINSGTPSVKEMGVRPLIWVE